MMLRQLPVIISTAILCASAFAWLVSREPLQSVPDETVAFELPSPQPLSEALPMPIRFGFFDNHEKSEAYDDQASLKLLRVEARESAYRLCAFAGGSGFWIVSVEGPDGRYHTIQTGDMLPGSSLEFRGMEFRTSPNGAPESVAIFNDLVQSRLVEVRTGTGRSAGGPVCVVSIPGGTSQRLHEGEQISFAEEVWTLRRILENPPKALLTEQGGRSIELSCPGETYSASSSGKE